MKKLLTLAVLFAASASFAGTYYYDNLLTANNPTYHPPGSSTLGTGVEFYSALQFTVDTTGTYDFETASPNTSTSGISNAIDTFLTLYAVTFTPATPGSGIASNDDFTGAFTVLPGPYAGTVGLSGTGFTGLLPASRFVGVTLTAGTTYFLVNSSFRDSSYVTTGTEGGATGHFYTGISGQGNISTGSTPEPASIAGLALGGLVLLRRRKKN